MTNTQVLKISPVCTSTISGPWPKSTCAASPGANSRTVVTRGVLAAHEPGGSDLSVGLALAHAHQDLTVVIHLKPLIGHPHLRGKKSRDDRATN
jgi:hypothetical protein